MVFKASVNTGGGGSGTIQQITSSGGTITVTNPTGPITNLESAAGGGNVNTTGSPALGNIAIFSGATTITNGNLAGDVTTSGSPTVTLATVNANVGSYGSGSSVPIVTVNAKGLTTGISTASYLGSALSGTSLASGILTSSLTQVGTLATATWNASTITVPYGGTGLATLTAHGVMLGEGTSNVGFATVATSGRIFVDNGASADPSFVAMVGDATITNNATITLATVNSQVGTYGSTVSAPVITVNAKGLITAVSTVTHGTGTVTTTGSPAVGNIAIFSSATSITNTNLAGDVTTSGGSTVTLATVNSNVGSYGSTNSIPIVTVNAKGLTTAVSTASITVVTSGLPVNQTYREIAFALDGQGSAIASGGTWYLAQIPYSGNISTWSLVADQSGSINIDVWKKNAAVPTVSSTITSTFLPGLTSTQAVYAQTIQGWSSTVTAGDCFGFKVNAATTVQKISLTLQITAS